MKRKLLSILLTFCLAFSLLPTAALAAEGEDVASGNVAKIGNIEYATLAEAVAAVHEKTSDERSQTYTIELLRDATGSGFGVGYDKIKNGTTEGNNPVHINIEMNGHTYTVSKPTVGSSGTETNGLQLLKGSTVTFKNGTLNSVTGADSLPNGGILIQNYCNLTLENVTLDTSANSNISYVISNNFGSLTAKGNTVIKAADGKVAFDLWYGMNDKGLYDDGVSVTFGTDFTGSVTGKIEYGAANRASTMQWPEKTKLTIENGKFEVTFVDSNAKDGVALADANISITGGTFSSDVSAYVADGYILNNGTVEKLGETNAVAKVGETYYKTLADAVAAVQNGDTIKLLKSCSSERVNLENKSITIDLNGNTLTSTSDYGVMFCAKNGHKITVNGTKEGSKLVGTLMVTAGTDGHIEINGGTYESSQYCPIYINGSVSSENSTLTVKNATITASNSGSNQDTGCGVYLAGYSTSAFENTTVTAPSTGIEIRAGRLTLTNCNVTGGSGEVTADANGNGTTVKNAALAISQHTTKKPIDVTINGGTFTGKASVYQTNVQNTGSANVKASVKNGNFNGMVKGETNGTIAVSGGTFTSEVPQNCCAPGFVPKANSDGTHGVKINENMAAEVLDAQGKTVGAYDTLAAAITAAKNGETVKLLKDAELTSTLNLAKNITIDGQGNYTIKAANNFTVGKDKDNKTCCVLYVSGEVTLKDVTVNGNEKCRVIFCDKGKLTIDGATITNGKAPNYIGGVYMTSSASFEMKSGSITGNKNAEGYQDDKYLQYSSDLWIGANANGALTAINGGTIGNVFVNANKWSASNPGSFTMNGGTVTNLYVEHDANYGATFKYNDGTIEHLYLSKENGNGQSIEVTPVKGVIYNGGVKEEDLVTLTLKYNDGATADTTYNVASGTTITLPTPAYRSGYTFNGWYDGSTKVSSPYKVTKNVILTASWSYNYSGGSSSYDPTYSVSTPSKAEHGTVTVSPKSASKGDTVTVTVKPDSGYVLETLTVTDKNGNELTLKDKGNGKYTFTMPAGKVEVKATFMEDNSMLNFFYDVPNNAYFYEAVKWAVKNGITDGVGNNLFAPEQPCTRAQIVTFLWRAAGSPEPKGAASGMTDVVSGSYYEKAVAWAIENGITTGTTTSTFSPDATCTRAQAVTFLARALKAKAASAAEFSDVPTDSYFADAVAWAAANGVTEGIGGGLFGSDNDCTRGQIVTFLYRAYNK